MKQDLRQRASDWFAEAGWNPGLDTRSLDALLRLSMLVEARAVCVGLVAASDRDRILERHILDCLRAIAVVRPVDRDIVDIGTGAGLPGLVLAIALPDRRLTLVDSRARAAGFVELAAEELGLSNVDVRHARVEDVEVSAHLATARAFADVERSWAAGCRILRPGGRLVYFAGESWRPDTRVAEPEPPAAVRADPVVETSQPLVMMDRSP